jgi:hypothetical protein
MSRDTLQTITSALPVIVELGPGDSLKDAAGRADFLHGGRGDSWVRVVRTADVKARLRTIFTPKELSLYVGAVQLKQALEAGDEWALQSASDKVRPWIGDFAEFPNILLEIDTAAKRASIKRTGTNRRYSAFVNYSRLLANAFERTRLVMWYSEKNSRLMPALYCPDWKTAAFVVTFMGRVRVCANPKCNAVFVPLTDKEHYCTPAHGVAYRVARSRWRAKQRASKQTEKKNRLAGYPSKR